MPSFKITVNVAAFNTIRNSPEIVAIMEDIGNGIKARADAGVPHKSYPDQEAFTVRTVHNATRAVTFVSTSSEDGMIAEAANRTLTNAIG